MTIFRHRISPIPREGFTLIEVLVVICIVAVLAGLIMPVLANIRQRANATTCVSNLRQIGVGAALEMADNDGRLPDRLETVNNSRFPYSIGNYLYPKGVPPNGGVFMCPSSLTLASGTSCLGASLGNSNENGWLSYGFNLAVGYTVNGVTQQYRISQVPHPATRALAWESNQWNITTGAGSIQGTYAPRHKGTPTSSNQLGEMGNFLFMDGHVESRVMSMNPINTTEWNNLGTWSESVGNSNILQ